MKRIANGTAAAIHALSRILVSISLLGMLFVLVMVVFDVATRTAGHPGVVGVVEYVEVFALGDAERRRVHVSVEMVLDRLKGRAYLIVRIAAGAAAALVAVLLAWASGTVLLESIATGEYKLGLVSIPMWPARAAVFAGFLVLALEQIVTAVEDVRSHGEPKTDGPVVGMGI